MVIVTICIIINANVFYLIYFYGNYASLILKNTYFSNQN